MPIEAPYMTTYLMAIVLTRPLSATIYEIFTIKIYMTLTLTFRTDQDRIYTFESKEHKVVSI